MLSSKEIVRTLAIEAAIAAEKQAKIEKKIPETGKLCDQKRN